jgi:hypothetical protein
MTKLLAAALLLTTMPSIAQATGPTKFTPAKSTVWCVIWQNGKPIYHPCVS